MSQAFMAMSLQDVQSQGLGHFGLLPFPSPSHLINMS